MTMADEDEETRKLGFQKCSLRMKRAILTAKRGPTTPVPSWRASFHDAGNPGSQVATRPDIAVSARKLAAALWELQEIPTFTSFSSNAGSFIPRQPIDDSNLQIVLPLSPSISNNPSLKTLKHESHGQSSKGTERSSQFLKALSHIHNLEERNTSSKSLASALQVELEHARAQMQDLELAHRAICKEMNHLLKKFAEERAIWHSKGKERIKLASQSLKKDLEEERKSRRQLELINTRLGRELGEANIALSRALKDLERERKARELMEDVCDELAREIGEGKAEVEELKVASAKVKEEVEQERRMLQMAEVWREERVQMKLSDARLQLQERNSALDRLRSELEEFLGSRRVLTGGTNVYNEREIRKGGVLRAAVDAIHRQGKRESFREAWQMDGAGFIEDDLHSIDLNKATQYSRDENCKNGYPENTDQAIKVKEKFPYRPEDSFKEQKRKSRRTRIINRAKILARSRSSGCAKEPVTANPCSIWEPGSDADTNQSRDSLTHPEKRDQGLESSCFKGRTSISNLDKDSNEFSHIDVNCEGSPTSTVDESLPFERTQSNTLMTMHQADDANYGLNGDTYAWELDFSTSEGTSVNVDSPLRSHGRNSFNLCDEHSLTTLRTENPTHAISTLTSLSSQMPATVNQKNSRSMTDIARIRQNDGRSKSIRRKWQRRVYMKNRKVS